MFNPIKLWDLSCLNGTMQTDRHFRKLLKQDQKVDQAEYFVGHIEAFTETTLPSSVCHSVS